MPALHHAVLDHQAHAAVAGVVDQGREDAFGLTQVLGDAVPGIAADERSDGHAPKRSSRVDAGAQMGVIGLPLARVGGEVVVVVRECGQGKAVLVQRTAHALGLGLVEGVRLDVARGKRSATELRPGGELECFVAIGSRPRGDALEGALGHAGRQEAELHGPTAEESTSGAGLTGTSIHRSSREEVRTASVIRAARRPSENVGIPSTGTPSRMPS